MRRFPVIASLLLLEFSPSVMAQEPNAQAPKAKAQSQVSDGLPTSCGGLALVLRAEIDRMRKLQERAAKEEKAPPSDLLSALQRTFGKKGDGIVALNELKKVRQRGDDLNAVLRARSCPTIDIDQALKIVAHPGPVQKSR
jgi:hypothetical protein